MSARPAIAALAALLCVAGFRTSAQDTTSADAQAGHLAVFPSPRVKAIETEWRRVSFVPLGKGGALISVNDRYVLSVETGRGNTAFVAIFADAEINTAQPYADESEADIRKKLKDSEKYKPQFAEAVRIGGVPFRATGRGPQGEKTPWSSINYFGRQQGMAYKLIADYMSQQIATEVVREVMETADVPPAPAQAALAAYRDFLATAVSSAGVMSNFGPLPLADLEAYRLDRMRAMRAPAATPGAQSPTEGHYRIEYVRKDGGWISALCVPAPGVSRDALEQALFSGDVVSGLQRLSASDTASGEVRAFSFQRRALYGGSVPARAWTAYRDGTIFEISASVDIADKAGDALVAALSDPSRRCGPVALPLAPSAPASNAPAPAPRAP
jgi:hypothetical protein